MKALYFAWVRERIGKAEEEIVPPENIKTVAELMAWLSGQVAARRGSRTPPAQALRETAAERKWPNPLRVGLGLELLYVCQSAYRTIRNGTDSGLERER